MSLKNIFSHRVPWSIYDHFLFPLQIRMSCKEYIFLQENLPKSDPKWIVIV